MVPLNQDESRSRDGGGPSPAGRAGAPPRRRRAGIGAHPAAPAALAALLILACAIPSTGCRAGASGTASGPAIEVPEGPELQAALKKLEKDLALEEARGKKLQARVPRVNPTGFYIVVDTGTNHL
jgi:hypothetical protein